MARLNFDKLANAIVEASEEATAGQVETIVAEAVKTLNTHKSIFAWRRLARAIEHAWVRRYGLGSVTVMSAHPLSAGAKKSIDEASRGADVTAIVDDRLLGGAVVRFGEQRIDGSLLGALMRLKSAMYSEV